MPPAKIDSDQINFGGAHTAEGAPGKAQAAELGQKKQQESQPETQPKTRPEAQPDRQQIAQPESKNDQDAGNKAPEKSSWQQWKDNASQEIQHQFEGLTNWIPRN